jgi:hypothetical protein
MISIRSIFANPKFNTYLTLTEATSSPTSIPTSNDPAEGNFLASDMLVMGKSPTPAPAPGSAWSRKVGRPSYPEVEAPKLNHHDKDP